MLVSLHFLEVDDCFESIIARYIGPADGISRSETLGAHPDMRYGNGTEVLEDLAAKQVN